MSGVERLRRHRARQAAGRCVIAIEVDEVALAELLIAAGALDPSNDDRNALCRALELQLQNLIDAEAQRDR